MIEAGGRLGEQLRFITEIDKVKQVLRQTVVLDATRRENDAEHSWHLAVMALTIQEHAAEPVDLLKVIKMVLIHDLVEIDAGDTFAYDEVGALDKEERERKAADRIFYLLPEDQAAEIDDLWTEFELRESAESRFAAALDRFQPLLHNYLTEGVAWKKHGIQKSQVIERNKHIAEGSQALWDYAQVIIDDSVVKGYLGA
jgi:putative hydrolase of HD superfamily